MDDRWNEQTRIGAERSRQVGEAQEDTAAIRAEIERTRARMSETVDELGYRLDPNRLKRQVKQNIHDATVGKAENMARNALYRADETRHSMVDTLRDNPVPAAMIGVGLGWLFVSGRRHHADREYRFDSRYDREFGPRYGGARFDSRYAGADRGYRDGYEDRWGSMAAQRYRAGIEMEGGFDDSRDRGVRDRVSHAADSARDSIHETQERVRDRAHEMREEARESIHDTQERVRDRAFELREDARDRVTEIAHEARDGVRGVAASARGFGHELADTTRQRADRVEDRFDATLHDSPLAVGAAAVALGLAVGMAAPATRRESELMGGTRDHLFERARDRAEEVGGRVKHVAERVADQVQSTARDAAQEVKSTAREAAEEEGLTRRSDGSRMGQNDPFRATGSTGQDRGSTADRGFSSEPSTAQDAFRGSDSGSHSAGSANEPPFGSSSRDDISFGNASQDRPGAAD